MEDDEDITLDEEDEEEEPSEEDKTPDKKNEGDKSDAEDKKSSSAIAQKKRYREKYINLKREKDSTISELKAELAELKSMVKKPTDEAEAKAQDYIRGQARAVFDELQKAQKSSEQKIKAEFSDKVDEILDENPDISEEELLDACEEYEVDPKVALKILKRQAEKKTAKPKMPQPKRSSSESKSDKPDDSKKTMWQIANEEIRRIASK